MDTVHLTDTAVHRLKVVKVPHRSPARDRPRVQKDHRPNQANHRTHQRVEKVAAAQANHPRQLLNMATVLATVPLTDTAAPRLKVAKILHRSPARDRQRVEKVVATAQANHPSQPLNTVTILATAPLTDTSAPRLKVAKIRHQSPARDHRRVEKVVTAAQASPRKHRANRLLASIHGNTMTVIVTNII